MKEQYISPEMKLLCFAPMENLANGGVDFGDLWDGVGGEDPVSSKDGDIDLELPL